jgi:mono/diheme cytochrome c family protein
MRVGRWVSGWRLSAVAAAIFLGVAGLPAVAEDHNDGGHRAGQKAEKAMPMHTMKPGSGDSAKAGQGGAAGKGATALLMPMMDPARGRKVFAAKGCVICHAINGIGGNHGPELDMSDMGAMNPFDFAAKMWEGAEAMIVLQEEELGERISLTGQDLADMIAFVHNPAEIRKFSAKDVPHRIMDVYQRTHGKAHSH